MLITKSLDTAQIRKEPFPHIIANNVLPETVLKQLTEGLPSLEDMTKGVKYGSNRRLNYSASDIQANINLPDVWKMFVREHLGQPFLNDIVRLFGSYVPEYFPEFEQRFGKLSELKAGIRPADKDSDADVLLDCQLAVNTPVTIGGTTVRSAHIDCPKKLFVGLLYLRLEEDESSGGDLLFYRAKTESPPMDETRTVSANHVEVVEQIPYRSNTLVLFLNTPKSFHGVSTRSRTPCHRMFINLLGEMKEPIFQLAGQHKRHQNIASDSSAVIHTGRP